MTDSGTGMLRRVADEVLAGHPDDGDWSRAAADIRSLDWHLVGIDEACGGAGGSIEDLLVLAEAIGYHAAAVPFAEQALAAWVSASAGSDPAVPAAVGPVGPHDRVVTREEGGRQVVEGTLHRIPWGRETTSVLVYTGANRERLVAVEVGQPFVAMREGFDLAGEPRDDVELVGAPVAADLSTPVTWEDFTTRGMLLRLAMTAGVLERLVDITSRHVAQREQFGRPLARLQLVSARLATMAVARSEARAALNVARTLDPAGRPDRKRVLGARVVIGRAGDTVAHLAHQLHGAVGTTREHQLHRFTTRIWAWQDEWMAPAEVARELGQAVLGGASAGLWSRLIDWSGAGPASGAAGST